MLTNCQPAATSRRRTRFAGAAAAAAIVILGGRASTARAGAGDAYTTATWFGGDRERALVLRMGGSFLPVRELRLGVDWALVHATLEPLLEDGRRGKDRQLRASSPAMTMQFAVGTRRGPTAWLGLGATLPVATLPDSNPERGSEALAIGRATLGWGDAWLWEHDAVTLFAPCEVVIAAGRLRVRGSITPAWIIAVDGQSPSGWGGAALAEVALDERKAMIGLRLRAAVHDRARQTAQFAIEPFVSLSYPGNGGELALTVNLDEPDGFAFEDGGRFGLHLTLSARF